MNNQSDIPTTAAPSSQAAITKRLTILLRAVIAAVLLYAIFSHIGLDNVISQIGTAHIWAVWFAFIVAIIVQFVVSYRLKCLTDVQGLHLSTWLVFEVNLATRFYGLFLPGGNFTGLLIRIFRFSRERSQIASVVVSLFADRIMATLSLCILGLLFWALSQPQPDSVWLMAFVVATVACLVLSCALFVQSFSNKPNRMTTLFQKLSARQWAKMSQAFQRSHRTDNKVLVSSLALSILAHLIGIVGFWLIGQSLGMDLSPLTFAWIRSGMLLATLLPITIAGLGVREVAALALLQLYGVETNVAIAFSLLVFATTVVGIGLIGGITETWRFVYSRNVT